MKLSTKTVASLLVVTAVAATVPGLSQIAVPKKRRESQFDKLLQTQTVQIGRASCRERV